jgi:hypothetical protein
MNILATVKVVKTILQNMTPRLGTPSHDHCKITPYSSITVGNIKHSVDVLDTSVVVKHFAYDVSSNHLVYKTVIYRRHHL